MSAASTKTQDPSMDEILASIRRIIADDQDAPKAPSGPVIPDPAENDDILDLAGLPDAKVRSQVDLEVEVPDLSFSDAPEEMAETRMPDPVPAVVAPVSAPSPAPEPIAERPAESLADAKAFRPDTLVSNDTVASVSQAFNILSHTILTQNARTLEDLVRDMLKPMLKVWLDDNLPPLVERLVKTEIERVARGHR